MYIAGDSIIGYNGLYLFTNIVPYLPYYEEHQKCIRMNENTFRIWCKYFIKMWYIYVYYTF